MYIALSHKKSNCKSVIQLLEPPAITEWGKISQNGAKFVPDGGNCIMGCGTDSCNIMQ
jgi:hypothetical protein